MSAAAIASLPRRFFHGWVRVIRHMLPPTLYFFTAFNLIVFTTNLLAHDYWFNLTGFMLASTTALIVGKVVLVVEKVRIIDKFRGAPLIQPILYKTVFYGVVVTIVRYAEKMLHFIFDARGFNVAAEAALADFTWHRFVAVQIWIFVCFLLYVTASELNALVGDGQLRRLFFHHRSSEYRLTPPPAHPCADGDQPACARHAARETPRPGDAAGQPAGGADRQAAAARRLNGRMANVCR